MEALIVFVVHMTAYALGFLTILSMLCYVGNVIYKLASRKERKLRRYDRIMKRRYRKPLISGDN